MAARLGSSRCARNVQNTSAIWSGRWHSTSLPPSRSARVAQAATSSSVQLPVWRAAARRGSGLVSPPVK